MRAEWLSGRKPGPRDRPGPGVQVLIDNREDFKLRSRDSAEAPESLEQSSDPTRLCLNSPRVEKAVHMS